MFCSNCGNAIDDMAKFCSLCGTPVVGKSTPVQDSEPVVEAQPVATPEPVVAPEPVVTPEPVATPEPVVTPEPVAAPVPEVPVYNPIPQDPPKKKKGKAGLVITLILIALLLIGGGVFAYLYMNRPVVALQRAFGEGNVDEAIAMYDKITSEGDVKLAVEAACVYAMSEKDAYLGETKDYATVSDSLNKLDTGLTSDNADIATIVSFVEAINESRSSYEEGLSLKNAGDNVNALASFNAVTDLDKAYYEKAQNEIVAVSDAIRADAIAEADKLADSGQFEEAKKALDDALVILKDDATLIAEQGELETRVIQDYADRAQAAVDDGHYSDAFSIITEGLLMYPDNAVILAVKDSIPEEAYLIGTWGYTFDISTLMATMDDEYAEVDVPLEVTLLMTFKEDGTLSYTVEEKSLMTAYTSFVMEYTYITFEDEGYTREEADELVESVFGMSMADYVSLQCEEAFDDMYEDFNETGKYEVDGNKLYSPGAEDEYEIFTVEGDTLTLDLPGDNAGMELFPGVSYPITLHRVVMVPEAEGNI